jgi:hypothetical protein
LEPLNLKIARIFLANHKLPKFAIGQQKNVYQMVLEKLAGVPKISPVAGIVIVIINTFIMPGAGTCLAGIFAEGGFDLITLIIGICQILLFPVFGLGYLWAFWSSMLILIRAGSD